MHVTGGECTGGGGVGGMACILFIPPGYATGSMTRRWERQRSFSPQIWPCRPETDVNINIKHMELSEVHK
jgi:hypothetical protein